VGGTPCTEGGEAEKNTEKREIGEERVQVGTNRGGKKKEECHAVHRAGAVGAGLAWAWQVKTGFTRL